jgi:hypothetical protein
MLDMQLLNGALLALAVMVGGAIALSVAMVAAAAVSRRGGTPRGGTRRVAPRPPLPDDDRPAWPVHQEDLPVLQLQAEDKARELVLR